LKLLIINGPNLNLLGRREPEIYGTRTMDVYLTELRERFPQHEIAYFQSNVEGEIIDALQGADCPVVLNAGGYTHTSVAIRDAVAAIGQPVVEVHISSLAGREEFRHTSLIAPVCKGSIMGFGLEGYRLAIESLI
jgi:3-dehydroquinate dehydratase-2